MKRKMIGAVLALAMATTGGAARANQCDNMGDGHSDCVAIQLGTILGSETACGLKYDEEAIKAFIVNQIRDDVSFMSTLKNITDTSKAKAAEMSKGFLAAHCTIVRRAAEREGFIK
jgi:hypothetical protein